MMFGKTVIIRPVEASDQAFIHALNADSTVRANVVGWEWPTSLHQQESWFESAQSSTTRRWVIEDSDGRTIGLTGLWDVDWHNRNALTALKLGGVEGVRGRGLGTDAIMTLMAFAFYDVGLERLHTTILSDNVASLRAYSQHCGWSIEGTARKHVWRHGEFKDLLHLGILKEDFDALPEAGLYVDSLRTGRRPQIASAR